MKALFIPEGDSYSIELISENREERELLIKYWDNDRLSVSAEEWRERSNEAQSIDPLL